jgi:hypothetical protein
MSTPHTYPLFQGGVGESENNEIRKKFDASPTAIISGNEIDIQLPAKLSQVRKELIKWLSARAG